MKINNSIFLNLQKNKNDKLKFIKDTIKILENETVNKSTFYNEDLSHYFEISKKEIIELNDNSIFNDKKISVIKNFELILNTINQFKVESIEEKLKTEIFQFLSKNSCSIQCIVLEFDHYHNPKPNIIFHGENDYKLLDGKKYENKGFYGKTRGWIESDITFKNIYKPIYNLEWLEDEFGLNELFYTFTEYILSEIFLIFYKIIHGIDLNHPNLIMPLYFYIREHEIEPFSLFVKES